MRRRVLVLPVAIASTLGLALPSPAVAPSSAPRTRFTMRPEWEPGFRPRLLIAWESLSPPIAKIHLTVKPAGGTPRTIVADPGKAIVVPPGLDPLTPHELTARLTFKAPAKAMTFTYRLAAFPAGPRPLRQEPPLPPGATVMPSRPNPCVAIRWRYNPDRAPFDALPTIRAAIDEISRANGITYIDEGTTTEFEHIADLRAHNVRPSEHPRTWMLIQWEDPARPTEGVDPETLAFAGPGITRGTPGLNLAFADGATLVLRDKPEAAEPGVFHSTLLHELGHTAGLDHVEDPTSVMTARFAGVSTLGANDIATLNAIGKPGSGGCIG